MLTFLDIEASSLSARSWPIEIGLARIGRDGSVVSEGRLIRPDPSWPEDDWSQDSAAIHGISLAELASAEPAVDVAAWAEQLIGAAILVSDAPEFDAVWLERLMSSAGLATPELVDLDAAAARAFGGDVMEEEAPLRAFYRAFVRAPHPHRAEADARGLAEALGAGKAAKARFRRADRL